MKVTAILNLLNTAQLLCEAKKGNHFILFDAIKPRLTCYPEFAALSKSASELFEEEPLAEWNDRYIYKYSEVVGVDKLAPNDARKVGVCSAAYVLDRCEGRNKRCITAFLSVLERGTFQNTQNTKQVLEKWYSSQDVNMALGTISKIRKHLEKLNPIEEQQTVAIQTPELSVRRMPRFGIRNFFRVSFFALFFMFAFTAHSYYRINPAVLDGLRKTGQDVTPFVMRNIFRNYKAHDLDTVMSATHDLIWNKHPDHELAERVLLEIKNDATAEERGMVFYNLGELEKARAIKENSSFHIALGYFEKSTKYLSNQWLRLHKAQTEIARIHFFHGETQKASAMLLKAKESYGNSVVDNKAEVFSVWAELNLVNAIKTGDKAKVQHALGYIEPEHETYDRSLALGYGFLGETSLAKKHQLLATKEYVSASDHDGWVLNLVSTIFINEALGLQSEYELSLCKKSQNPIVLRLLGEF